MEVFMKSLYEVKEIINTDDYQAYVSKIDANVKSLQLGKIQSKKYYESFAILKNRSALSVYHKEAYAMNKQYIESALDLINKYHNK
jgi:hypothetical protein